MVQVLFNTEEAVTKDWLTYIENVARALSQSDEFTINGYADRELLNSEVQTYLQNEFTLEDNVQEGGFAKAHIGSCISIEICSFLRPEQSTGR